MPDTKSGRERKGKNKRAQLRQNLYEQELDTLNADDELPEFEETDGEFLADQPLRE